MATKDEMSFEDAFAEDAPAAQPQSDDEAFGLALPAADAAPKDGATEPVAAVVVDVAPAGASASAGGDENGDNAQANADAANAAANEGVSAGERGGSTPAVAEAGAGAEGGAAEEAAESTGTEAAEQLDSAQASASEGTDGSATPDPYDLSDVPPEDMQKAKSWVGRLKKLEADLKARSASTGETPAAATSEAIESAAAASSDNPEMAQAAETIADKVESGEMTAEQALKELAEDFGDDFIRKLQLVMGKTAGDTLAAKLSPLEQQTKDIIDHITDGQKQAHFEQIFSAHPDFAQVAQDPAFTAFAEQQGKQDVIANGSAAAINQLITDFKASQGGGDAAPADAGAPAAGPADAAPVAQSGTSADAGMPGSDGASESEIDAAEGVRGNSGGLQLPTEPTSNNDDFAAAWEKF